MDARVTPRAGGSRCAANPSRSGRAAHTQLTRASPWLPPRSLSRTDHKQDTQPRKTNPAGRACTGAPSGRESTAATDGNARRHRKHLRGGTCGRRLSRGGEGESRGAGGRGRPRHTHTKEYEQNHIEKNGGRSDASGKGGGGGTNLRRPQRCASPRRAEHNSWHGEQDSVKAERLHNNTGPGCTPQSTQQMPGQPPRSRIRRSRPQR